MANPRDSLNDDLTQAGKPKPVAKDERSLGDQSTANDVGSSVSDLNAIVDDIGDLGEVIDLTERYEIQEELGHGGMGRVFKAFDRRLKRTVAIKRLKSEISSSRKAMQRFRIEAQAIASLNHPYIVQIYDFGRDADGPYLILEYVEGETLADQLLTTKINAKTALEWTWKVCDALEAAHQADVIHRDVKPANILVSASGHPKLADFGLAQQNQPEFSAQTQAGTMLGTFDFMSPEQRRNVLSVDARSDIWSLGASLYQLLTGNSPRVIRLDAIPGQIRHVLGKALEEQPDRRYQTANEFAEAIKSLLSLVSKSVHPVGPNMGARSERSDIPAQLIAGLKLDRFELIAPIGDGATSLIWKAMDPTRRSDKSHGFVALKFLRAHEQCNPEAKKASHSAFLSIQKLQHQNICPVYDFRQDTMFGCYIVMKFLDGISLTNFVRQSKQRNKRTPISNVAKLISDACSAVGEAHRIGMIHGELSPEKIFIGRDKRIQVTGFGGSQSNRFRTADTLKRNTAYLAPEQIQQLAPSAATDQYALAVIAWELLTGNRPFQFTDPSVQLHAMLTSTLPPGQTTSQVESVFRKALAPSVEHRYVSLAKFSRALVRAVRNTSGRKESIPHHSVKEPSPRRIDLSVSVRWLLGGGLFASAFALLFFLLSEPENATQRGPISGQDTSDVNDSGRDETSPDVDGFGPYENGMEKTKFFGDPDLKFSTTGETQSAKSKNPLGDLSIDGGYETGLDDHEVTPGFGGGFMGGTFRKD